MNHITSFAPSPRLWGGLLVLLSSQLPLRAEDAAIPIPLDSVGGLDSGNTAWMLASTVLVLFMTLPGLALFYGGLVRAQNVLSVLMHCFAIACMATVLWVAGLYSLAFAPGNAWIGDLRHFMLNGIAADSLGGRSFPETVFVVFQMTFAIITPGLIVGAFVERIRFAAVLLFSALWLVLVYAPVCHWVWGGGWLARLGVLDLAGGIVVHATAGISALVLAWKIGPREGFPTRLHVPHSPVLVMIGASMLWVGWFGFNAGSQLAANGPAGMTLLVTHLSAAVASLTWMSIEWIRTRKPGLVGIVTGMVAGLATITPASGNVGPLGAMLIGLIAGLVCYFACAWVKGVLKVDDSLDVFAVHGIGGMMGTLLLAVLGTPAFGGFGVVSPLRQLGVQALALVVVVLWSALVTWVLAWLCRVTVGLRVDQEVEYVGLDSAEHGERAYHFD
jgi:Amt family ammonium transporter